MAKAKQRYMEIVEEFPIELHKPMLRLADAIMERIRTEFAVRREDFDELRTAIAELAQAQKRTEERVEELAQIQKRFEKHFDMQIGALGSRWGIKTEESFRAAAEGILGEDFGMRVERYMAYDEEGEVFGRPDQIEIDILIRDDKITAIEIKSSMSKSDVYTFDNKVSFYEKRHQVKVDRKLIITPMLDPRATELVKTLGMKVYTSCYDWGDEEQK
jgi:hypothetical protein